MSAYATKLAEAFASQVIKIYYEDAVTPMITNQDYEGEIRDKASTLNILTFGALALRDYSSHVIQAGGGASSSIPNDVTESNGQLVTDQAKAYYFRVYTLDKFLSYIKNPEGTLLAQAANALKEKIDLFNLALYTKAGAGNWLGTPYATGTVTVDVTTGVVTGSGTTFTSAMATQKCPFKAVGHTKWYRVKTYSSATSIVIEDDNDDVATAYTGGAIVAGAAYQIQANTVLLTTSALINSHVNKLATMLNEQKVPKSDRWLVVPAALSGLIRQAPEYIPAVETAYNEVVRRGLIGNLAGFTVYENQQIAGDNVSGWRVVAGHKSAITHAMGMTESGIEDLTANFGKAYKGLFVYGSKVVDERKKALATAWLSNA